MKIVISHCAKTARCLDVANALKKEQSYKLKFITFLYNRPKEDRVYTNMADFTEPSNFKSGVDEKNNNIAAPPDCMNKLPEEDPGRAVLTKKEWSEAKTDLIGNDFVKLKYPRTMKLHADPPIGGQFIGLISFIPSKDAVPDKQGCFGVLKLRGNFENENRADKYAETLIRQHDSYAVIDYCYVGKHFPLMVDNSAYRAATKEIDIRKKVDETVREDIKKKREVEKQEMEAVQERHRALMADVSEEKEKNFDDIDFYLQLRVKKANLQYRMDDLVKRIDESKDLIAQVSEEIKTLDKEHPEFRDQFIEKYKSALETSGIEQKGNPLLAYMIAD